MKELTSGECLALARPGCFYCLGLGKALAQKKACGCVRRAVWRACYRKFRQLNETAARCASAGYGDRLVRRTGRKAVWGFQDQEFCADFCSIAKRTLGADSLEYKLFRFHFLLGADWKLCAPRLGLNRGEFFHAVYRVQQKLGEAFYRCEPYSLWPLDEYFGHVWRGVNANPTTSSAAAAESLSNSLHFPRSGSTRGRETATDAAERSHSPLRPPIAQPVSA